MMRWIGTWVGLTAVTALVGCMPKMTIEEMKAAMPDRPAELDRLNAFAGSWQVEGVAKFSNMDQELKISGQTSSAWAGNDSYLTGTGTMTMEEFGDMHMTENWTYDSHSKKYRSTWVDSYGATGIGQSWFDEKNDRWEMRATGYGPWGKSTMKGWTKFIDADTMEWMWSEYAMGGMMKTMEMTGTSRRR